MNPPIHRRSFVKLSLLAAASTLARRKTSAGPSTPVAALTNSADVIVIGAGMSGVSAARDLQEYGLKVIVLEGRTRIGGRMWTNRIWPSDPVDMGAQWIQRSESNPLKGLARALGLHVVPTNMQNISAYDYTGRQLDELGVGGLVGGLAELFGALYLLRAERQAKGEPDISLEAAIELILQGRNLTADERRQLNFILSTNIENPHGANVSEFSFYSYGEDDNDGLFELMMPQGYDQLPNALARNLDVRMGQIVRKIEHGGDRVRVTTVWNETFDADQVIVTLPLGVLQSGTVEFAPALPPEKLGAINRLKMGVVQKMFLRFPEQFWPADPDFIGYVSDARRQWTSWVNFSRQTATATPVLAVLHGGDFARQLEQQTVQENVNGAMRTLRTIYGPSIPEPVDAARSTWGLDPFSLGAYSFIPLGATPADYDRMAEPVGQRLFFAGEATSRRFPSSVHGAYLSGKREAGRILTRRGLLPPVKLTTRVNALGEAEVAWPANAPGYVLQYTDDLNEGKWEFPPDAPAIRGAEYVAKDLRREAGRFYRLMR